MANSKGRGKKKQQGMSPTFKAGLIIIVVMFLVWGVVSTFGEDAWYDNPTTEQQQEDPNPEPVSTADEKKEEVVVETPAEEEPVEETPVEEDKEPEETEVQDNATLLDDSFDYDKDPETIVNDKKGWSFRRNTDHSKVQGYNEGVPLEDYDAFYIAPTEDKVIYLTFDNGYEFENLTSSILDTLSEKGVQAAFFVTESYIRHNPELAKRMKDDGHIVANHSVNHPSMPTVTPDEMVEEIKGVETSMMEHTGYPIDLFFRPPMGEFSERSLYVTRQQGYKTIFWSMAYQDWYTDNQPGKEAAYDHVMTNYHPGAIILLHAVSRSNTEALPDIIDSLIAEGYRFGTLYELPSNY